MPAGRFQSGFTLIELAVGVAIIAIMVGIAATLFSDAFAEARAKNAARELADLMSLARQEAIRTGDNHLVFFFMDAQDNPLAASGGTPAAALMVRDADGDGLVDAGEQRAFVRLDPGGDLSWGSDFAAPALEQAPEDNPAASFPAADLDFACCTLLQPDGDPARWVAFLPDGMPRAFSVAPFTLGDVTSGNGAVYLASGQRDYAVVLHPLGGIRVHAWDRGRAAWRN